MSFLPVTSRALVAALFVWSGASKALALEPTYRYIEAAGLPVPALSLLAAIALEIGGGLALAAGWRQRLAATTLGLFSISTAIVFHHNLADENELIHFMKNLAIAGGLFAMGAAAPSTQISPSARRPIGLTHEA